MGKLAAPFVARSAGGGRKARSAFNEGVQVPQAEWDKLAAQNPALNSKNKAERTEAVRKSMLSGELAKFRRR